MRTLILDSDYPEFLRWLYRDHAGLAEKPYSAQAEVRAQSLFGIAGFYAANLRALGHEAWDVQYNNEILQAAWAREHAPHLGPAPGANSSSSSGGKLERLMGRLTRRGDEKRLRAWTYSVLAEQIKKYRPDILLNLDMVSLDPTFLHEMKENIHLIIGQHAATPLGEDRDYSFYGLAVSSFPPTVDWFRMKGLRGCLLRLAFEPDVLATLASAERTIDLSFVGSLFNVHSSRIALLETLCNRFPQTRIWTSMAASLPAAIRRCCAGDAWGREMYRILASSKITLNHHGDVAPFANNLRLYEATGMGALLVTDWKANLHEIFEPEKEVITYKSAEECCERIAAALANESQSRLIALAGQNRTLKTHTYRHRMAELMEIVDRLI